jgi:CubicO group peptidase (beta-lactamase class C family)
MREQDMNKTQQGFAPGLDRKLVAGMESGLLHGLHAVAVARNDETVLEQYFAGPDEHMGDAIGDIAHGPETQHDLRSVTKSIVSVLYGIALERGLVPPLDAPIVDAFPEYPELRSDPERRRITVGHALSMTMGLEWDESLPYSDPRNSEIMMEMAPDRYRFALDRPIVEAPGTNWIYSGGAVALVGALIERGSKQSLGDFAREALFAPLGIAEFTWWKGEDGVTSAAAGLRLQAPDLLRIGSMLVAGGVHEGKQIVAKAWLDASFAPATKTDYGPGYGRLWYLGEGFVPGFGRPLKWIAGFGYGGQRLWLMPEAGLAVVTFSGEYGLDGFWISPDRVWSEIVLRNLVEA